MKKSENYRLYVYGEYANAEEAKRALQTPFVEDFVEETGKFRTHNFQNIRAAKGISLGDLIITQAGEETFEITSGHDKIPFTKQKMEELADKLEFYAMFDEIEIKPVEDV